MLCGDAARIGRRRRVYRIERIQTAS